MPHTITPDGTSFTAPALTPDPGELIVAADLEAASQAQANRSEHIKNGPLTIFTGAKSFSDQVELDAPITLLSSNLPDSSITLTLDGSTRYQQVVPQTLTGSRIYTLPSSPSLPLGHANATLFFSRFGNGMSSPPSAHTVTIKREGGANICEFASAKASWAIVQWQVSDWVVIKWGGGASVET